LGAGVVGALSAAPRRRRDVPLGRVEVTYWEKWTAAEGAAMQRVVDRYNDSQRHAFVRMVPVSDITSKAMVAIGGGDPPDVVGLYSYSVPGYAEARAAIPFDELATPAAPAPGPDAYAHGVRRLLTHGGRTWAGVNTCYTLGLYVNRSIFRAAGLDPDRPPRTVDELDDLAARLTVRDASGRIERAGFLPNVPDWWPYSWPVMFGAGLYDEAADRATCAGDECLACFRWLRAAAARAGVPESRAFAAAYNRVIHSAQDPFLSGRQAMIVQGPWLAAFIRDLAPGLDYACAPVPVAAALAGREHPTGLLEADVLMVPRGCRHPELAWDFVRFTQRPDVQEELALAHAKPSPMAAVSEGFHAAHPNRGVRAFDAVVHSPDVRVLPRTRVWKAYADLLGAAFDAVWSGADPAPVLDGVQRRAQDLLDTAAARRRARAGGRPA
jgi:ABC-type glycerol-3-phosphate transport system substrate-binding protein